MAKKIYIGVNSVSRKVGKAYIGINGVARKIKKAYIGINGVARQFYSANNNPILTCRFLVPTYSISLISRSGSTVSNVTAVGMKILTNATYTYTYSTSYNGWVDQDGFVFSKYNLQDRRGLTYSGNPVNNDVITETVTFANATAGTHYNSSFVYNTNGNTCLALFTNGKLVIEDSGNVDMFLLGGGGSGGVHYRVYYRYYNPETEQYETINTNETIEGGQGGTTMFRYYNDPTESGGTSNYYAFGGDAGYPTDSGEYGFPNVYAHGGSGGAGGGGAYCGSSSANAGDGGTNGGGGETDYGGAGQGTNMTRAFCESTGNLYGGGGGGAYYGFYHNYEQGNRGNGGSPNGTNGATYPSTVQSAGGYGAGTGGLASFSSNLVYNGFVCAGGGGGGLSTLESNMFLLAQEYPVWVGEGGYNDSRSGRGSSGLALFRFHSA